MIEAGHPDLSIGKQCALLSISRSSFYYRPKGETALNLALMRRIDEQFLETPFYGVRQMTWHLRNDGHPVNEKRIRRLMRLMGLMPIYQKPNTSKAAKGHKTYPYLLKELRVGRPNQVWAADITYLPMRRGFLYLVAIMDLAHAQGSGLAHLEHAGSRLLRRGVGRSHPQVRTARDHEHRSGLAVHVLCLDGSLAADPAFGSQWMARAASSTTSSSNGSGGSLKYECVLSACLGDRIGGQSRCRQLD